MTVRSTMSEVILTLRGLTDASVGETTVNGIDYWDDEQLQSILDAYRVDALDVQLIPAAQMQAGITVYKRFYFPEEIGNVLENGFTVVDENGNTLVGWSYIDNTTFIDFASDQSTNPVFIRGTAFNLRKAAARVWFIKASHRSALIDWKAGGQTLSEDQEYQHCVMKFEEFAGPAGVASIFAGIPAGSSSVRLKKVGSVARSTPLPNFYPSGLEEGINGPVA